MIICIGFQSTPSVWRETNQRYELCRSLSISIHSLRVEGDTNGNLIGGKRTEFQSTPSVWRETSFIFFFLLDIDISIHSLRVEGDFYRRQAQAYPMIFQSTPSVWRETLILLSTEKKKGYFNPLPPCGGRLDYKLDRQIQRIISIHSLRVEGDKTPSLLVLTLKRFQSTPSVWRETLLVRLSVLCG